MLTDSLSPRVGQEAVAEAVEGDHRPENSLARLPGDLFGVPSSFSPMSSQKIDGPPKKVSRKTDRPWPIGTCFPRDERRKGGEREMGVVYVSKEHDDGPKDVHVRAKNDHFRSKMSADRSIVIAFASKGSRSGDKGRLFLSKLTALRDIQRHFASNLPHLARFLPNKGTKGAPDRAFAGHFPWKVGRERSIVTVDRGRDGQKPDKGDQNGSKVTGNVEVDRVSVFFVGQNRGFEDEVVRSS